MHFTAVILCDTVVIVCYIICNITYAASGLFSLNLNEILLSYSNCRSTIIT